MRILLSGGVGHENSIEWRSGPFVSGKSEVTLKRCLRLVLV